MAESMITVNDLPSTAPHGVSLYCPDCHAHYSATKGDYFWMPAGKAFRCGVCDRLLHLVQRGLSPLVDWRK